MEEHFFHYLLAAIPLLLSVGLLFKDKYKYPSFSRFKLFSLIVLGLFVFTFASPCHTLATDHLLQNDHAIHDCCIVPAALTQPTVHFSPGLVVFVEQYVIPPTKKPFQNITVLDNKSPPLS